MQLLFLLSYAWFVFKTFHSFIESQEYPLISCTLPDLNQSFVNYCHHLDTVLQNNPSDEEGDQDGFIVTHTDLYHEHCMTILTRLLSESIKQKKEKELENMQKQILHAYETLFNHLAISNSPIGTDHWKNEYYLFRGDSNAIYVHVSIQGTYHL